MSMDLSLRHLPDLSSSSEQPQSSETSFQIPTASSLASDLLLADDTADFFGGINETLSTPAPGRSRDPLTLEELTPQRSKTFGILKGRSHEPRPAIPSPLKQAVALELSVALEDTLSPFKRNDDSFQIPTTTSHDMLTAQGSTDFLQDHRSDLSFTDRSSSRRQEPLTLSQLTPLPQRRLPPSSHPPIPMSLIDPITAPDVEIDRCSPSDRGQDATDGSLGYAIPSLERSTANSEITALADQRLSGEPSALDHLGKESTHGGANETSKVCSSRTVRAKESRTKIAQNRVRQDRGEAPDKVKVQSKRTVIEGGISKRPIPKHPVAQNRTSRSTHTLPPSNLQRPRTDGISETVVQDDVQSTPAGLTNIPPSDRKFFSNDESPDSGTLGLAATLMSYGQRTTKSAVGPKRQPGSESLQSASISVINGASASHSNAPESDLQRQLGPNVQTSSGKVSADVDHDQGLDDSFIRQISSRKAAASNVSAPALTPTADHVSSSAHIEPLHGTPDAAVLVDPPSPMRSSLKRPMSPGPSESQPQLKRSKGVPTDVSSIAPSQDYAKPKATTTLTSRSKGRVLQSSRTKNVVASSSRSASVQERSRPKAESAAQPRGKSSTLQNAPASSSNSRSLPASFHNAGTDQGHGRLTSSDASDSSVHGASSNASVAGKSGDQLAIATGEPTFAETRRHPPTVLQKSAGHGDPAAHASGRIQTLSKLAISLPPAKPTRPIEFHFHSDARLEARKTETDERSKSVLRSEKSRAPLPIPDFKAMHAAQEAELAARRNRITPVLPGEIELNTDVRAHEREKFEEARRAREREAERLMEERRRQRELEEEKEIKELRRRAVPKANEIPEWYANAPKRSHEAKS